jgi:hypothetical protein
MQSDSNPQLMACICISKQSHYIKLVNEKLHEKRQKFLTTIYFEHSKAKKWEETFLSPLPQ